MQYCLAPACFISVLLIHFSPSTLIQNLLALELPSCSKGRGLNITSWNWGSPFFSLPFMGYCYQHFGRTKRIFFLFKYVGKKLLSLLVPSLFSLHPLCWQVFETSLWLLPEETDNLCSNKLLHIGTYLLTISYFGGCSKDQGLIWMFSYAFWLQA